ncbi:AraC family transcriptional regulator [uncultured Bartonella sp.]|uniref:helix-turn-helix domain-containing protein n=1 Tax=uncultured Bartonella sp. TaxID=104108 RepID=UPI002628050B|nr:AraC family transcriptional regulator [uncultured Bartonella sp.]
MFVFGKALELAAYIIQDNFVEKNITQVSEKLNDEDVEKIYMANQILVDKMQKPPTLSQLALSVGSNTKKLTFGFRRLFNNSVFGQLQTIRLEKAYKLLNEGSIDVSTVAYQIGYSPAHLTVAFKKQYGFLPKDMKN